METGEAAGAVSRRGGERHPTPVPGVRCPGRCPLAGDALERVLELCSSGSPSRGARRGHGPCSPHPAGEDGRAAWQILSWPCQPAVPPSARRPWQHSAPHAFQFPAAAAST